MELQTLNIENGLDMMGGETALYKELMEEFIKSNTYSEEEVLSLIAQNKHFEAGSKIHRMKGAAASIGAEKLQEICSKAERILRGKEEGDALPLIPIVTTRYKELLPELEKAIKKFS